MYEALYVAGAAIGGCILAAGAGSAIVPALGFKANGIVAGSTAAKMMSSAALAAGGGVKAGSFVALCQSTGVLGLATKTIVGIGVAAGSACAGVAILI